MVLFAVLVTLIAVGLSVIFYFSRRNINYWSKQENLPYSKPTPILGNYGPYILQRLSLPEMSQRCCQQHPDEPLVGALCLTEPVLLVQDPEYIKLVMTKDFYYFSGRENSNYAGKSIITKAMFFSYGDNWRVLRQNLTPLFTSSKMKNMFHLISNCSKELERLLDREALKSEVVEMHSLMARFTMDCICSASFGINSEAMLDNTGSNPFHAMGEAMISISWWRGFKLVIRRFLPCIFYGLGLKAFPDKLNRFFNNILTNVFESRDYKPSPRQDFVDLMLSLKNNKYIVGDSMKNLKDHGDEKVKIEVEDEMIVAQCISFFAAGFETAATSLGLLLFELGKHPEIQEKVLEEVDSYMSTRNEVQYDCLTELPFLEQCIDEASRLYPVPGEITREVYDQYVFPNGVRVKKGQRVHIPVYHVHRNPKYWPEPNEFKPERFSPQNKINIKPYTFMPFGEGPRNCIGMRFAKMQMMAGLVTLLKKYRVQLADGMPRNLTLDPSAIVATSDIGIKLKVEARAGWEARAYGDRD